MPFGIGGGRSRSRSSSSSSSFDNLDASSFDVGFQRSGSSSVSGGSSSSFDRSGSSSSQRVAFGDVFANLFGTASGIAGGIDTGQLGDAASLLFSAGGNILDDLRGGGAGAEYLETRLGQRDGLADMQVEQLGDDLSRFLAEDVNPAITSGGVAASTLGGSRGEVQRGIASRGASEAFVRGATDIRVRDQAARDSIAAGLMESETARGGIASQLLPQMYGLAEAGVMSALSPMQALSQILGPQLALTESESFGVGGSQSEQFAQALSEMLGFNIGGSRTTGRAGSSSRSSSSSSASNFSLTIPGPTG